MTSSGIVSHTEWHHHVVHVCVVMWLSSCSTETFLKIHQSVSLHRPSVLELRVLVCPPSHLQAVFWTAGLSVFMNANNSTDESQFYWSSNINRTNVSLYIQPGNQSKNKYCHSNKLKAWNGSIDGRLAWSRWDETLSRVRLRGRQCSSMAIYTFILHRVFISSSPRFISHLSVFTFVFLQHQ